MSSGNFLMFFLGLEMASVPLACMVAFDKDRKNSAEGAAKYILVATFSSGIMLFGISFIYAATGTLYFDDVAAAIKTSPLAIMGLVFFFSGLGFKISLVPFHFWTADTYQGAPTPVTGYLSVISKGAAAITLCIILMKVFQPLVAYWEHLLYIVIVLCLSPLPTSSPSVRANSSASWRSVLSLRQVTSCWLWWVMVRWALPH